MMSSQSLGGALHNNAGSQAGTERTRAHGIGLSSKARDLAEKPEEEHPSLLWACTGNGCQQTLKVHACIQQVLAQWLYELGYRDV